MKDLIQIEKLQSILKNKVKNGEKIYFLFDYDGTLVPIQRYPDKAFLPKDVKNSLIKLSKNSLFKVALVSGRTISTLKKLTGIRNKDITFIGSHGYELLHKGKKSFLSKATISEITKIKIEALKIAQITADGFLEHKPYTFTYHIRDKRKTNHVLELCESIQKLLKKNKLEKKMKIMKGKNIVEILPIDVSKGNAIKQMTRMYPNYFYIYFGDDVTDISAMNEVDKYKGLSVSLNKDLKYKYKIYLSSYKLLARIFSVLN